MKVTPGSIEATKGEHVVLTGPISGSVTLEDGTTVDVTPAAVVASSPEEAAAIAHAVGTHYAENGHPTDPDFSYEPDPGKKA